MNPQKAAKLSPMRVLQNLVEATNGKQDDWLLWRLREIRDQAIAALPARIEAPKFSDGWNPVETIPRDRRVLVKTVTGLERIASVVRDAKIMNGRIYCWRRDKGHTGDIRAVAWKELER